MLPGGVKQKVTGLQDGYFSKEFGRVFEKEAYSDPIGTRRRKRVEDAKKNLIETCKYAFDIALLNPIIMQSRLSMKPIPIPGINSN